MFRAVPSSSSGSQIVLLQIWYRHSPIQCNSWERTAVRSQPVHWMAAYGEWGYQML